jgi:DNA-binding NarL/FixJ family response regulator
VKVLLVDDHAVFRSGLASLLRAWGFEVVGQAGDGDAAIEAARILQPELIFMDIAMPGRNGLEATRAIHLAWPRIRIIMLTASDAEPDLLEAIRSGAEGYLLKNLQEEEFSRMVEVIRRGEPAISGELARRLLQEFARGEAAASAEEPGDLLTEREHEVLAHLAAGATNREIGVALGVSPNTVSFHVHNILGKLHLRNRAQVVVWAMEHGIHPEG